MACWVRLMVCCSLWLFSGLPHAATAMEISTLLDPDPATSVAKAILGEAYARLGLELHVQAMPGERSLLSANTGKTDGELYRKGDIALRYANLRQVPVPLMTYEIVAFCRCKDLKLQGWESLRPYQLSYVKGIKIVEDNTAGMQVEPVGRLGQAFDMLMRRRSDLVLANRISGLAELRAKGLRDVEVLSAPLASFPVFHYLHKRHEALLPKLTEVLRQMERDKSLQRIRDKVLSEFAAQP